MSNRLSTYLDDDSSRSPGEVDVVEVALLLPGWQVSALESAAHVRGLTAGQMVRSLLRDFIGGLPGLPPGEVPFHADPVNIA